MRLLSLFVAACVTHPAAQPLAYPETPKRPVTDTYHGVQVTEDYRWLENGKDPAVREWSLKQLEVTRAYLDRLPHRARLVERFRELHGTAPVRYYRFAHTPGGFFAMKRQPPKNQPMLVVMKSAGDTASERILLDPNQASAGGFVTIDWFVPSLDGRYVAVSLSEKGSEDGSAHVIEVATGKRLPDVVPRVQYPTGGGSIAWDAKGTGFYYTRYPQGRERAPEDANFYQQVWFHKLGTPAAADTYVIGKEFPRIAEIELESSRDGRYLVAEIANGDGGEYAFWLRDPRGRWRRVFDFHDKVKKVRLGLDDRLYALTADGTVLAVPLKGTGGPKVVVPGGRVAVRDLLPTATRLYLQYLDGGPSHIRMFDLEGKLIGVLPAQPVSRNALGERLEGDEILVSGESYLAELAWYRFDGASHRENVSGRRDRAGSTPRRRSGPTSHDGQLIRTSLATESKVDFSDAEVVREMAVSKDGTRVPVNIVMKKGTKLDGSHPVLLYGYGGYSISMQPSFSERTRVWLDAGGIYAVANLRGGGEFGEAWHLAGNLTRKQNVFDDMIAVAEHLVARGYTKPERLAAQGGSNGGLLMGAILTQRPDLFRAIACHVGVLDMLRVELTPNGAFNVTEFGTVKDRAQFEALHAYSPYHRVKDGTAYPAVLLTHGEQDGRVDPFNSRKMAARLQAATSSRHPILLRISMDTGHGAGTPLHRRVEQDADTYAFLMGELGMTPK